MPSEVKSLALKTRYKSTQRRLEKANVTRDYWRRLPKKLLEARLSALEKAQKFRRQFFYAGVSFRSTWEVAFAKWCRKMGLRYRYEAIRFKLAGGRSYLPDFYLVDSKIFVEIKAYWWEGQLKKFQEFLAKFPEAAICVFDENGLNSLGVLR